MTDGMRRGDLESAGVCFFIAVALATIIAVAGWNIGFDAGVKAHATGRYVVVKMPDGTDVVCENKAESAGK